MMMIVRGGEGRGEGKGWGAGGMRWTGMEWERAGM